MECSTIEYKLRYRGAVSRARGVQVGRFAVRCAIGGLLHDPRTGGLRPNRGWSVDHINSGRVVADFDNFTDALACADDLSRFSRQDPASREPARVVEQLGTAIARWQAAIEGDGGRYTSFRNWREQESA